MSSQWTHQTLLVEKQTKKASIRPRYIKCPKWHQIIWRYSHHTELLSPLRNNQSYLEIIGYSARSLWDFPMNWDFPRRWFFFLWSKALSCKSLLTSSIVLTWRSSPNGWRVQAYSSHLHLPNSADFSLICMTRGNEAKGPTLTEQSLQKNNSHAYSWAQTGAHHHQLWSERRTATLT